VIENVCRRVDEALTLRATRHGIWETLQNYLRPSALSWQETQSSGDSRERRLMDTTGPRALELFASFLFSSVFVAGNANSESFKFEVTDAAGRPEKQATASHEFKKWAEGAAKAVRHALYSGPGSAIAPLHEVSLDLGLYGTSVLAAWENRTRRGSPIIFRRYSVWNVAGEVDADGKICAIYLCEQLDRRQAQRRWPDREVGFEAPGAEKAAEKHDFVFALFRRDDPDLDGLISAGARDAGGEWFSAWINKTRKLVVAEAYYPEQPVFFPRWLVADDNSVFGRSPGMTALGDAALTNNISDTVARGIEKLVDPPWLIRDGALLSPLRAYPGGLSYTDGDLVPQPLLPPGASRIELGDALLRTRQQAVREAFFVHLFQTPEKSGNPRTAFEVQQDVDERNRAVAPMVLRMQAELMEGLIWRTTGILLRRGIIEPPPAEATEEDRRLRVTYNSPIVASQKQIDSAAIMRWFESLAAWAQVNPDIVDHADLDGIARLLHEGAGAPTEARAPRELVEAKRRGRQEAIAQQQQQEQLLGGAEAIAKLTAAQRPRG
jgi:hypothetical protein